MNSDFSKIVFAVMIFAMHFCGFCIAALENTFQVVQPVLNEQSEMTQAEKSEKSEKNQASESGEKVLPEKMKYNLLYLENYSFGRDFLIMIQTVLAVCRD